MPKTLIPNDLKVWIDARKRFHLSHAQIQMARELGLNPKKLGGLANHKQEPWKLPLPEFIEHIYFKRFKKQRPDTVMSIEDRAKQRSAQKAARRKAKITRKLQSIGAAWYRAEQWPRLREISADADKLEETYEGWLYHAEAAIAQMIDQGIAIIKVPVDVNDLEAWCRQRALPIDGAARVQFVIHLLQSADTSKHECESESADPTVPF